MKVLIAGLSNTFGGAESIVLSIVLNIIEKGSDIDFMLILPRNGNCEYIEKIKGKIDILEVPSWGVNIFGYRKEINHIFKKNKIDVVWLNTSNFSNIDLIKIAKYYTHSRIIVHSHGCSLEAGSKTKRALALLFHKINRSKAKRYYDYQFACSKNAGMWLFKDNSNTMIIKNAINIDSFRYSESTRAKTRNELGVSEKRVVLHVGRFVDVKNHKKIINILEKIINHNANYILLLVGEGPLVKSIKEYIVESGMDDYVRYLGFRSDISEIMQASDVFILPSKSEGFPLTLVEAQATGLPCVISDVITKEIKLTDLVSYVPLDDSDSFWAANVENAFSKYDRAYYANELKGIGYDLRDEAERVEGIMRRI